MSKQEIFNWFYTNSANFGVKSLVLIMLAALLIAGIIKFPKSAFPCHNLTSINLKLLSNEKSPKI